MHRCWGVPPATSLLYAYRVKDERPRPTMPVVALPGAAPCVMGGCGVPFYAAPYRGPNERTPAPPWERRRSSL